MTPIQELVNRLETTVEAMKRDGRASSAGTIADVIGQIKLAYVKDYTELIIKDLAPELCQYIASVCDEDGINEGSFLFNVFEECADILKAQARDPIGMLFAVFVSNITERVSWEWIGDHIRDNAELQEKGGIDHVPIVP